MKQGLEVDAKRLKDSERPLNSEASPSRSLVRMRREPRVVVLCRHSSKKATVGEKRGEGSNATVRDSQYSKKATVSELGQRWATA